MLRGPTNQRHDSWYFEPGLCFSSGAELHDWIEWLELGFPEELENRLWCYLLRYNWCLLESDMPCGWFSCSDTWPVTRDTWLRVTLRSTRFPVSFSVLGKLGKVEKLNMKLILKFSKNNSKKLLGSLCLILYNWGFFRRQVNSMLKIKIYWSIKINMFSKCF